MIEIQRAEAKESGMENWDWETFLVVNSYKEASEQLAKLINDNDAIGDFFRVIETGTPPDPQHGREPEPKPLAQYLADQLTIEVDYYVAWRAWIQQALDAYESTENVTIKIERNIT